MNETSEQIEPRRDFMNPATGEVLTLTSPSEDLGAYLAAVKDLESQVRDYKRVVTDELLRRMDASADWTLHLPGMKLSAPSPAPAEEFDELALREDLLELVDAGRLSIEAVDRAIETVITYKAHKAGINALRKVPGLAEVIARHTRTVEKRRYVTVTTNSRSSSPTMRSTTPL